MPELEVHRAQLLILSFYGIFCDSLRLSPLVVHELDDENFHLSCPDVISVLKIRGHSSTS
jgi:hypothetical protein